MNTSSHQLTAQQAQAMSIARAMRLNIRLNAGGRRHDSHFHAIACRLWDDATRNGIPYGMVHGALQLLD